VLKRFILHAKKAAFIVEHDFIMATYLADRVVVYSGDPGRECTAHTPEALLTGMNRFLKSLEITFRRDPTNHRPRINKQGSVKDQEQKKMGTYFYLDTDDEKDEDKGKAGGAAAGPAAGPSSKSRTARSKAVRGAAAGKAAGSKKKDEYDIGDVDEIGRQRDDSDDEKEARKKAAAAKKAAAGSAVEAKPKKAAEPESDDDEDEDDGTVPAKMKAKAAAAKKAAK